MNPLDVAQAFLGYAQTQSAFNGWDMRLGQAAEEIASSSLIFDARDEPLCGSALVSTVHLTIIVQTHSQDESSAAHQARVADVRTAFFGDNPVTERTFRATVTSAINGLQEVISLYGYGAEPVDPTHDQQRFSTPLCIAALAKYV